MRFTLPAVATAADSVAAMGAIVAAVAAGELTPCEAGELSAILAAFAKAIETRELEERVSALEMAALK